MHLSVSGARAAAVTLTVLLAGLGLSACTGDDSDGPDAGPTPGLADPPGTTEPIPDREPVERAPADGVNVPETFAGRAPSLEIYVDFQCPSCRDFAQTYVADLAEAAEDGDLNVTFHHLSFLDSSSPNEYSVRAANAALCVHDAAGSEAYVDFYLALFEQQPATGTPGPEDADLISLARSQGVSGIDECITQRQNAGDVEAEALAAADLGVNQTPTVLLEGVALQPAEWSDRLPALTR